MDELAQISVSTGALNEARWKTGDLYVYRHRLRCPSCHDSIRDSGSEHGPGWIAQNKNGNLEEV